MSPRPIKPGFAARPATPDAWVRKPDVMAQCRIDSAQYSARLTIDVTPALRSRIKITAFQRGQTVADMLRDLLAREFPDELGDAP
ncbi:hypothetical protein ACOSOMT5_P1062 [Acidiphilium sp. MT5]